jgi:hypothetical protein
MRFQLGQFRRNLLLLSSGRMAMSEQDKGYFARRAAEEAEQALSATNPKARESHLRLQRVYTERASIGDRSPEQLEGQD